CHHLFHPVSSASRNSGNSYTLGSWQSIESARTIAVETIKCALQWQACLHAGALAKAGRLRVICAVLSNIVVAGGADPGPRSTLAATVVADRSIVRRRVSRHR